MTNPLPKTHRELEQLLQASATEKAGPENEYASISQLWFYCLLRATLIEQANTLPVEVFQMLLREAEEEARMLGGCITDQVQDAWVTLTFIRHYLALPIRRDTWLSLLQKVTRYVETLSAETIPELYGELGVTLAQVGEVEQARNIWTKVEQKAESKQTTAEQRVHQLGVLARALFQADFADEGRAMLERAERAARQISNDQSSTTLIALCEVAQGLIDTGQRSAAQALCREIRLGLQSVDVQRSASALVAAKLMALWMALQEDEQPQGLVALLEEMVERNLHTWKDRGELFHHLAAALSMAGHITRAEEVLHLYAQWPPIPEGQDFWGENGFFDEDGEFLTKPDERDKQAWVQEQLLALRFQQALWQHDWERAASAIVEMGPQSYTGRIAQQRTARIELLKTLAHAGVWKHALSIWQTFRHGPREEEHDLACTLIELAKPLLASGLGDQAQPLLRKALECAEHISWREHRVTLLQTLGELFARHAAWNEVEHVLLLFRTLQDKGSLEDKDVPPPWQYHAALVLIEYGGALAQAGQQSRAESVFEQVTDLTAVIDILYENYQGALYTIAEGLMSIGQEDRARLLATTRLEQSDLACLLLMRGQYLFSGGQHEQARKIWSEVEQIATQPDGEWENFKEKKRFALLSLIEMLLDHNEQEEARRLLPQAEAMASGLLEDQQLEWGKAGFLLRLVRGWARLHEFGQASRLVGELRTLCRKGEVREPEQIEAKLTILARQYHLADEDLLWRGLQDTIKSTLRAGQGPYPFYGRLLDLAEEMLQADEREECSILLAQLQEGVKWNFPLSRVDDLCHVGSLMARLGQWERAEAIARSIVPEEPLIDLVENRRVELLINVADAMAERGENAQIVGLIQRNWPMIKERTICLRLLRMAKGLVQECPLLADECYNAILAIH